SSGLITSHVHRGGGNLPRERDGLRRIVNGSVRLLGRGRHSAIDDMQLVPVIISVDVVSEQRLVAHAELLTILLTDISALSDLSGTIARHKLIRIGVSLDGGAKLLGGEQIQVLDVVRVKRGRLSTRRRLGNCGETIPSDAVRIGTAGLRVENTLGNA